MSKLTLLPLFISVLAGCALVNPTPPAASPDRSTVAPSATPRGTSRPPTVATAPISPSGTSRASSTATPVPQRTATAAPPTLTLKVNSPQDETIVNSSSITIIGQTVPGAVVSVNGNLADVDDAGRFQFALTLDEGPNIIEIVASDQSGNEQTAILRVIYEL